MSYTRRRFMTQAAATGFFLGSGFFHDVIPTAQANNTKKNTQKNDANPYSDPHVWRFGMSAALSGAAQALGTGMKDGIESWFAHINQQGGIHGKTVSLIALDDQYEPNNTSINMRKLIDENGVFAILGNTGTPTAAVAVPIANEAKVPLIGAFTGAGLLRKTPPDRYIINYRASYAQETSEMVQGITAGLGISPEQIAFFTQNDAYGDSGYQGGIKALQKKGFLATSDLIHARYPRNTVDIEDGLSRLLDPRLDPKAIIMVGAYKPCAALIDKAKYYGLKALFINVSFVGSNALADELERLGDQHNRKISNGIVVTQVVPPLQSDLPAVAAFREIVPVAKQNFVSLEGFLVARAVTLALSQMPKDVTREQFIDFLENGLKLDLGLGIHHRLSKEQHQLSQQVWPTVLQEKSFYPLQQWSSLRNFL